MRCSSERKPAARGACPARPGGTLRGRLLPAGLLCVLLMLTGCSSSPIPHRERYPDFAAMRAELGPLRPGETSETDRIREHYADATRGLPAARHDTGLVEAGPVEAAVHLFHPGSSQPRGTVVAVHGYLAHAEQLSHLVRRLLQENWVVVAPELPGHGLSGGERGYIAEFADYAVFLDEVLDAAGAWAPQPWHAVGHSTGATTIFELIRTTRDPFRRVILAAPLVRSKYYGASRAARTLSRPFMDYVATGYDDPLGVARMPMAWFDAQVAWNRRVRGMEPIRREVLVQQGTRDMVVAWRRNRRFLERVMPELRYLRYPGADHVLYREDPPLRRQIIDDAARYLSSGAVASP